MALNYILFSIIYCSQLYIWLSQRTQIHRFYNVGKSTEKAKPSRRAQIVSSKGEGELEVDVAR